MAIHIEPEPAERPPSWATLRQRNTAAWMTPILWLDWLFAHAAWNLSRWSLVKLLAYAETFSILIALVLWVWEAPRRTQQRHYQAWQVINTAQGKGGNGGRVDALQELNDDGVALVGVDVAESFLQSVRLDKAELRRATFRAADLREASFRRATLVDADFTSANLRGADFNEADASRTTLTDADLTGASLAHSNLAGARLDRADLRNADLQHVKHWESIESMKLANINGVQNAPAGFKSWAFAHGAVEMETTPWNAAVNAATPTTKAKD